MRRPSQTPSRRSSRSSRPKRAKSWALQCESEDPGTRDHERTRSTNPEAPIIILRTRTVTIVTLVALLVVLVSGSAAARDPLPSWNDGPGKVTIREFVAAVTDEGGEDYVEPSERIATFDDDGTLWIEYPLYTQFLFAIDCVKALAPQHPEWTATMPFRAVLEDDMEAVGATGMEGLMEIVIATHSGMTADEFEEEVSSWLSTHEQPRFDRLYTELVYKPQLELLDYLGANGFKTFIVSGGGIAFMRPVSDRIYGIPREQVIGSSVVTEFQMKDGRPVIMRMPKIGYIDDKAGKPVGIHEHIGRRPILAFGNSDSDMRMVVYTLGGEGRRLVLFVHHTDAVREYAYGRKSHVGKLDRALDEAAANGWIIVDMKKDWKSVFPD